MCIFINKLLNFKIMKTKLLAIVSIALFLVLGISCEKEHDLSVTSQTPTYTVVNYTQGLGENPGHPTGTSYFLPNQVKIIGDIRGGISGKSMDVNKDKYTNSFFEPCKSWVDYGTGTYVNLYIQFFNSSNTPTSFTIPGGLIFVDSSDIHEHIGVYQKGYILQSVNIQILALDTAFVHLRAYCLNHTLMPSNYNAIYYIGPVTNNPQLNQITNIMLAKQYPFGYEYDIQSIIWNVTDYGLTLTAADINYLNSLP
jgi:hypothetical protein